MHQGRAEERTERREKQRAPPATAKCPPEPERLRWAEDPRATEASWQDGPLPRGHLHHARAHQRPYSRIFRCRVLTPISRIRALCVRLPPVRSRVWLISSRSISRNDTPAITEAPLAPRPLPSRKAGGRSSRPMTWEEVET